MGVQSASWLKKRRPGLTLLLGILLLGACLRALAVSRFHFYTDSYNYMLMAKFFAENGRMIGSLGDRGGLFVPSPSPVYKWAYPMSIALPVKLGWDPERAGRAVCFAMGLSTVLLASSLSKSLYGKVRHGAWGALLMAASYENVTWGGFVLADVPGLFWILLSLWSLVVPKGAVFRFLAGLFLAMAGLSRTELCVIALPLMLLLWAKGKERPFRLFLFAVSFLGLWISVTAFFGARIPADHFQTGGTTPSLIDKVFGRFLELQRLDARHVLTFVVAEGALCLSGAAGLLFWARERSWGRLLLWGAYAFPLALLYNVSPNEHHRYYTQLLPCLLLPSVYALGKRPEALKDAGRLWTAVLKALPWIVGAGVLVQCAQIAFRGHREMDYPQEAGKWVKELLEKGKVGRYEILFCVEERALFFYTGMSCRELSGRSPYLDPDGVSRGESVLFLVDDYQVRPRMPGFVERLETSPDVTLVAQKEAEALSSSVYALEEGQGRSLYLFRAPGALAWRLAEGDWKEHDG